MVATAASPGRVSVPAIRVVAVLAALASVGAGVVHFAYAPAHLTDSGTHGAFFLAVAWVQLAAAVALWRGRKTVLVLGAAALFDAAVIAVWLVSRTAGIDGVVEPAQFADVLATSLEAIVVVSGLLLAAGWQGGRLSEVSFGATSGIATVAVIGLVSASLAPGVAGSHSHATAGGHDHALAAGASHDGTGGTAAGHTHTSTSPGTAPAHDHGAAPTDTTATTEAAHNHAPATTATTAAAHAHDTAATDTTATTTAGHDHGSGSGSGTGVDWETTRRAALLGGLDAAGVLAVMDAERAFLSDQLRSRSGLLASLPAAERESRITAFVDWVMQHALDTEHGGNHTDGPAAWISMNQSDTLALQGELQRAATVVAKYHTAADAMDDGYFQVTPWAPGIGAHYLRLDYVREFDVTKPSILLFNGNSRDSVLVGVSYAVLTPQPPSGFTGPNDSWHEHPALCVVSGLVVGADSTPANLCASIGGEKGSGLGGHFWMMHLWQVPGWESPWGLFSGENPMLNLATTDILSR